MARAETVEDRSPNRKPTPSAHDRMMDVLLLAEHACGIAETLACYAEYCHQPSMAVVQSVADALKRLSCAISDVTCEVIDTEARHLRAGGRARRRAGG